MIRRLTIEDWDEIEDLIDTRKVFQGFGMDDNLHTNLKEYYIKARLGTVYFYGYWVDGVLMAMSAYQVIAKRMILDANWTRAGSNLPRHPGSKHPAATIELRDFALKEHDPDIVYRSMPADREGYEKKPDAENNILFDNYDKEFLCKIPAMTKPDDYFLYQEILVGSVLPSDLDVYVYYHKRLPPRLTFNNTEHPPMGDAPVEAEMPPRVELP